MQTQPNLRMVIVSILSNIAYGGISNEIASTSGLKLYPEFLENIHNITVTSGREAILSCIVQNLGNYRVGWLKVDSQTILSLQKRVVTHNNRISVTHDEHRTWNLHIRQVKESDRGCYMCQLNTPVMKNRIGCIEVYVPPNIKDDLTSSETTVNEGEDVSLCCKAEGYPTPQITWRREEENTSIRVMSSSRDFIKMDEVRQENLTLISVTRQQMGAYLCIASNGVPPIVSKRIQLNVNFSPIVKVDNQLIGSPLGLNVEIKCEVQAFPSAVNYWQKANNEMLLTGPKYELSEESKGYKASIRLQIRDFSQADEGMYKCLSSNSLGRSETSIRLYVISVPTPAFATERAYGQISTQSPQTTNSLDQRRQQEQKMFDKRRKNVEPFSNFNSKDDPNLANNRKPEHHENSGFSIPGLDFLDSAKLHTSPQLYVIIGLILINTII